MPRHNNHPKESIMPARRPPPPPMRWDEFRNELWKMMPWTVCYETDWKRDSGFGKEVIWWNAERHLILHAYGEHRAQQGMRVLGGWLFGQTLNLETQERTDWGTRHLPAQPAGLRRLRQNFLDIDLNPNLQFISWEPSKKTKCSTYAQLIVGPADMGEADNMTAKLRSLPQTAVRDLARLVKMTVTKEKLPTQTTK